MLSVGFSFCFHGTPNANQYFLKNRRVFQRCWGRIQIYQRRTNPAGGGISAAPQPQARILLGSN
jgi:hypothetical protein